MITIVNSINKLMLYKITRSQLKRQPKVRPKGIIFFIYLIYFFFIDFFRGSESERERMKESNDPKMTLCLGSCN